jgi:hypothetical protein
LWSSEVERRRRWARLQVLAASPENPELAQLIRETQNRINREHESLIDLIRTRMPGRHVPSARVMRMLNQNVMFGFLLEDLTDNPISQDELDEFLLEFFERMYEPRSRKGIWSLVSFHYFSLASRYGISPQPHQPKHPSSRDSSTNPIRPINLI